MGGAPAVAAASPSSRGSGSGGGSVGRCRAASAGEVVAGAGGDELPAGAELSVAVAVAALVVTGLAAFVATGGAAPAGAGVAIRLVIRSRHRRPTGAERRVQPAAVDPFRRVAGAVAFGHEAAVLGQGTLAAEALDRPGGHHPEDGHRRPLQRLSPLSCRASSSPTRSTIVMDSPSPSALPLVPFDAVARRYDRRTPPGGRRFPRRDLNRLSRGRHCLRDIAQVGGLEQPRSRT